MKPMISHLDYIILQTDGKNQSSGDTAMAEPVAISQFDNSKMSHIPQDHVVVGDGWVPPAEKNVIELEFNHKLPPKISNDPFRYFFILKFPSYTQNSS